MRQGTVGRGRGPETKNQGSTAHGDTVLYFTVLLLSASRSVHGRRTGVHAGDGRQETGDVRRETGDGKRKTGDAGITGTGDGE